MTSLAFWSAINETLCQRTILIHLRRRDRDLSVTSMWFLSISVSLMVMAVALLNHSLPDRSLEAPPGPDCRRCQGSSLTAARRAAGCGGE